MSIVSLWVYRDLSNRAAGEPDDGPMAWKAHRERRLVLNAALSDLGVDILDNKAANDEARTHELVETIVEIVKEPSTAVVATAGAFYVGKVIAKQIDNAVGSAVRALFQKLVDAFKAKKIGDFWITLPDGSRVSVQPDSRVEIKLAGGKVVAFEVDSPPVDGGQAH